MKLTMIRLLPLLIIGLTGLLDSSVLLAAAPTSCPASLAFGPATSPAKTANPKCLYGSASCLQSGHRHTKCGLYPIDFYDRIESGGKPP